MEKSSVVHTRISPQVKKKSEEIFSRLGITTSYAISLFLNQVVLKKGIPFEIALSGPDEDLPGFAIGVSTVDAREPSAKAKELFRMLDAGIIDLDTYEYAVKRMYTHS